MGLTTTDSDLLDRYARCGDEAAFRELVRQHLNLVYSSASRRVGDRHLAEDVTQAVFMILAQKANAARQVTPLSRWLLATVRYAAANALKVERRRRRHEAAAAAASRSAGGCSPNPADVLVWQEVASELDDAVLKLSAADRTAVLLRFFEQKPVSAVAVALDVTEAAAGMRVVRAVEKLRKRLSPHAVLAPVGAAGFESLLAANAVGVAPLALPAFTTAAMGGSTGTGATSLAIVKGVTMVMTWNKVKAVAAVAVAASVVGTGAVLSLNRTGANAADVVAAGAKEPPAGAAPADTRINGVTRPAPAHVAARAAGPEQEAPLDETERELVGRYAEVSRFPVAWTFSADRRYEVTTLGEVVERGRWHVRDHRELVRVIEEDANVPDRVGTVDVRRIENLSDSGLRVQVVRNGVEGNELRLKRIPEAPMTATVTQAATTPSAASPATRPAKAPARVQLAGRWQGEKDGIKAQVRFGGGDDAWGGGRDDAWLTLDSPKVSKTAQLKLVDDPEAGAVAMRLDYKTGATGEKRSEVIAKLESRKPGELILSVLPAAAAVSENYVPVAGIHLRRADD